MPAKSDYLATAMLKHESGQATWTPAATQYLALCTVTPISSQTGSTINEVAYTNYARQPITQAHWTAVAANSMSNTLLITVPTCGATGAIALGWATCDALTLGNMLRFAPLPAEYVITPGDAPFVSINALIMTEQ